MGQEDVQALADKKGRHCNHDVGSVTRKYANETRPDLQSMFCVFIVKTPEGTPSICRIHPFAIEPDALDQFNSRMADMRARNEVTPENVAKKMIEECNKTVSAVWDTFF